MRSVGAPVSTSGSVVRYRRTVARRRGRHVAPRPPRRVLRVAVVAVSVLAVGGMVVGLVAGMTAPLATAGPAASPSPAPVSFFDLNARADAPAKPAPAAAAATTEIRSVTSPLTSDDPRRSRHVGRAVPRGHHPRARGCAGQRVGLRRRLGLARRRDRGPRANAFAWCCPAPASVLGQSRRAVCTGASIRYQCRCIGRCRARAAARGSRRLTSTVASCRGNAKR
jgi:hypothetical protein